jgi:hypothetical protein
LGKGFFPLFAVLHRSRFAYRRCYGRGEGWGMMTP